MTQRQNQTTTTTTMRERSPLDAVVSNTTKKLQARNEYLTKRLPTIEDVLPPFLKNNAKQLVKRALAHVRTKPELENISDDDLYTCVLQAAEAGVMIDGKRGYIVNYKGKYQFQAHYAAIAATCRRHGIIVDAYADVVCQNDDFAASRDGGKSVLQHSFDLSKDRGPVIGAYCIVKTKDDWRYELMQLSELDAIQRRAPAKNGPWVTDPNEMRKKTVFRRCIKWYVDDLSILTALQDPWEEESVKESAPALPEVGRVDLRRQKPEEPAAADPQVVADKEECCEEFLGRISDSDKIQEMELIAKDMDAAKDFLGELYNKVQAAFSKRMDAIDKKE